MTVGIAFTNGTEAVNITDAQVSDYSRKSDSFDKSETFTGKNCHGVVFGTGSGNLILGVNQKLAELKDLTLEEIVSVIHDFYKTEIDGQGIQSLEGEKRIIEQKASLIANDEERKRFFQQEIENLHKRYDQLLHENPFYNSEFALVGYDSEKRIINSFIIQSRIVFPVRTAHIEIGSGRDGANTYFLTKLPGLDPRKLDLSELVFYAMNAYSLSNLNQGVGGTPKITLIDKNASKTLDPMGTVVLANLSGAYLSEYNPKGLSPSRVKAYFKSVLQKGRLPMSEVTERLGLNADALRTLYIPYISWQERVNRK